MPHPLAPPTQEVEEEQAKRSNHLQCKLDARKPTAKVDPHVEEQFSTGRLYGVCVCGGGGGGGSMEVWGGGDMEVWGEGEYGGVGRGGEYGGVGRGGEYGDVWLSIFSSKLVFDFLW